jgi:hypothetical protein
MRHTPPQLLLERPSGRGSIAWSARSHLCLDGDGPRHKDERQTRPPREGGKRLDPHAKPAYRNAFTRDGRHYNRKVGGTATRH